MILAAQFDANVQSSGTILAQNFLFNSPVTNLIPIQNQETVEMSVIPVDADLPACKITWAMVATFPPPPSTTQVENFEMPIDVTADVGRELFQYFGTLPKAIKSHPFIGPISVKTIKGPAGPLLGNLNIKGTLASFLAGTPVPCKITVDHQALGSSGQSCYLPIHSISTFKSTAATEQFPYRLILFPRSIHSGSKRHSCFQLFRWTRISRSVQG